ncbi:MAG: Rieske 2Fe-2S domain-containing protein [Planctomycetes bacterium]|nr:Rieske 2Fe-2S domain-containing protein [Planctomycetota bacterium]
MHRRVLLQWLSAGIATACSAIVALPGMSYVLGTVRKRETADAGLRRVAPLAALRPHQPVAIALTGSRSDAWTTYAQEVVGRVWLVRQSDETAAPGEARVLAFSTICPHLGCETQTDQGGKGFFCPCHNARFAQDGDLVKGAAPEGRNPAPRPLDSLECRVVQDEKSGEWWVEVKYEEFQRGLTHKIATA